MIRKILLGVVLLLAVAAAFVVTVLPGWFEATTNVVTDEPLPAIRPETSRLHATLQIADLHGDTLLWKRDLALPTVRTFRRVWYTTATFSQDS